MGNISTATESSFDVLESYFKKYPDVPKETILKQHMLSLGHWFSDAALGASLFHDGKLSIVELKKQLSDWGLPVRLPVEAE